MMARLEKAALDAKFSAEDVSEQDVDAAASRESGKAA
jgi:hypothetical protein